MVKNSFIQIGLVGKARGLDGSFFVSGRDQVIPRSYSMIRVGPEPLTAKEFKIINCYLISSHIVLKLAGVDDREQAQAYHHQAIWVERKYLHLNEDKEYLWSDLIDKMVIDKQGQEIGRIKNVYNLGASDVCSIHSKENGVLDLPLVQEYFVMDFRSTDSELKLTVTMEFIRDLWQVSKKN